jgi:sialic acid synthase SpsE
MEEAFKMIEESKRLGLWATKFQIYNSELIKDHPDRVFLKSIMIDKNMAMILFEHGREIGQKVFFSCMTLESIDWINEIGVNYIKIRHSDQWNGKLIIKALKTGKKVFISTDIPFRSEQIISLFCISKYPAMFEDYNFIWRKFESTFYDGISDHTSDLRLFSEFLKWDERGYYKDFGKSEVYFEKHVCLTKDCLEADWSCTFEELEEVLK